MDNFRNTSKDKSFNFFLPIAFILGIIPLIVRIALVKVDENTINLWGAATQSDLFSQKKAFFLMIFSIILIGISVIFFKKIFNKKDKIVNYILIAGGVFSLFTLLSAIFSEYKQVSFWGIFDRAEGFITIACYMILFIYSIYTFKNTNDYKYIYIPLLILVSINAFLGLFQYIGQDLIKTSLGGSIVGTDSGLNLLYEKGTIYGTFFSYNYVGSFVSIVLPILFCLTIIEDEVMNKIMLFVGTILSVWLLFGSTARSGIVGVLGATIFGIIVFWKLLIKRRKGILIGLLTLMVLLVGANFAAKGVLFKRIPSLVTDAFSIFKDINDFDYTEHTPVKDIKYTDTTAEVVVPNDTLKISYANGTPVFKNSKDELVEYIKNADKSYTTENQSFKNISFAFAKLDKKSIISDALLLKVNNQPTFLFKLNDDKNFHLMDMSTKKYIDLEYPETFGFKGKEKLGSARGYIWSRSLPLIKDTLILGTGPDTFAFEFPQGDLIGKYYAYDTPNIVVDKAHNLYLQIAINYGVIALLGFMAIILIYIIDSLKLYALKKQYEKSQALGAITCLGVIGYLFAGIFNDSVVSVAPIFWIILGVGVSLNFMNREALLKKHTK